MEFSIKDVTRLSIIKRWGIVDMSKQQSVAEHSYNVAMICIKILEGMDIMAGPYRRRIIDWALMHDLPEIVTGDIPCTIKHHVNGIGEIENLAFPGFFDSKERIKDFGALKDVVNVADKMEALIFAQKYCIDDNKEMYIKEMQSAIDTIIFRPENSLLRDSVKKLYE